MNSYFDEAFRSLDFLTEEAFNLDDEGMKEMSDFIEDGDVETVNVIDPDAETEDDLQDDYVGKVILNCVVCHSNMFEDKDEIEIDEGDTVANVGKECPFCSSRDGFKICGKVVSYDPFKDDDDEDEAESEEEVEIKDDGDEEEVELKDKEREGDDEVETEEEEKVEESLNEGIFGIGDPKPDKSGRVEYSGGVIADKYKDSVISVWCKDNCKEISDFAFANCKNLKTVTIRGKVDKIGNSAFLACTSLTKVSIPGTVVVVGPRAFAGCSSLKDADISPKVKHISNNSFQYCDVTIHSKSGTNVEKYAKSNGINFSSSGAYTEGFYENDEEEEVVEESLSHRRMVEKLAKRRMDMRECSKGRKVKEDYDETDADEYDRYEDEDEEDVSPRIHREMNRIQRMHDRNAHDIQVDECKIAEDSAVSAAADSAAANAIDKASQPVFESSRRDDIDADADDRKEYAKAKFDKIEDDADSDRDYRLKHPKYKGELPRKHKKFDEDFRRVEIETDDETMEMDTKDDGGVTVTTTPKTEPTEEETAEVETTVDDVEVGGEETGDTVAELSDDDKKEIISNSEEEKAEAEEEAPAEETETTEVDAEEIKEESFDYVCGKYLKETYSNVKDFKSTCAREKDGKLVLEGVISFASGAKKNTSFIFEAYRATKSGRLKFLGENVEITPNKKAFTLTAVTKNKVLVAESLSYRYLQEGKRVSGICRVIK